MKHLLILLLLSSCTPNAPHVFQAIGFSHNQQLGIQNAADEWCDASHGKYCPAIVLTDIESLDYSKIEYVNTLDHGGQYDIGMTTNYGDVYRVQIKACPKSAEVWCTEHIRRISLHEFGDTFDKPESPNKGTIMYPDISYQPLHLTAEDVY